LCTALLNRRSKWSMVIQVPVRFTPARHQPDGRRTSTDARGVRNIFLRYFQFGRNDFGQQVLPDHKMEKFDRMLGQKQ
jgi:hypothetical protein